MPAPASCVATARPWPAAARPGGQAAAMAAWDAGTVAAWARDSAMGSTTRTGIERMTP